jgi:hypothetical protein
MTGTEIVKALKELLETGLYEGDLQGVETISKALDFINRQQQENRQLHVKLDDCERDIIPKLKYSLERANKYGAETDAENIRLLKENERLNKILDFYSLQYGTVTDQSKKIAEIKAEAIKDFAERLKERTISYVGVVEQQEVIDNLVEEMIGAQQ